MSTPTNNETKIIEILKAYPQYVLTYWYNVAPAKPEWIDVSSQFEALPKNVKVVLIPKASLSDLNADSYLVKSLTKTNVKS